jgi:chromosome segregation and condensation protein ScpB
VQVNIVVVRAFVRLRQILGSHKELESKLKELEHKYEKHDSAIKDIFEAIRQLMSVPNRPRRIIKGFAAK